MFTNECKTIHNFVTISFYNDIVVKGRPQLSFLPPILLNQNFKLTENVQRFHFGRFLFYFFISSPPARYRGRTRRGGCGNGVPFAPFHP